MIDRESQALIIELADHASDEAVAALMRVTRTAPIGLRDAVYLTAWVLMLDNIEFLKTRFTPQHRLYFDAMFALLAGNREHYVSELKKSEANGGD